MRVGEKTTGIECPLCKKKTTANVHWDEYVFCTNCLRTSLFSDPRYTLVCPEDAESMIPVGKNETPLFQCVRCDSLYSSPQFSEEALVEEIDM